MRNSFGDAIQKLQRQALDGVVRHVAAPALQKRAEGFVDVFEPRLPRNSDILDIGGGWGFYHEPLIRRGHRHAVLDVVKPGFQKAPVVVYDGARIPFPDKNFDVSLFVTVLHHVWDPDALIAEAKRVTRSTVVVVEDLFHHAAGRWWTVLRDKLYNFEFVGHAARFRRKDEWIEVFGRQGLNLIDSKELYTWLAGMRILNGVMVFSVEA